MGKRISKSQNAFEADQSAIFDSSEKTMRGEKGNKKPGRKREIVQPEKELIEILGSTLNRFFP